MNANILRHQVTHPEMVQSYRAQMEGFVAEQLQKGHLNDDLAYLYVKLIHPAIMGPKLARPLAPLLFQHQILLNQENNLMDKIRQVVVIHGKLKGEVRYPMSGGKAMVSIYGEDHKIFLQDGFGNRYVQESLSDSPVLRPKPVYSSF